MKHKILFLCVGAWSFSLAACGVSSGSADLTEEAGLELAQAAIAASEQGAEGGPAGLRPGHGRGRPRGERSERLF